MMKKNETGRSMVEMLGVLAIIGVLSVAGIKGYSIAMRNYRANEIAQAISMTAAAMRTANWGEGIDGDESYEDLLKARKPAGVDDILAKTNGTIILTVDDGEEDVCDAVAKLFGTSNKNPIYIARSADDDCENGSLTLTVD